MPFVAVDINKIQLDPPSSGDEFAQKLHPEAVPIDDVLAGVQGESPQNGGFVPVDISKIKMDAPAPKLTDAIPQKPSPTAGEYAEDIAKSAVYRGVPEGLAATTPVGAALNLVRGVSDATRWVGHKISDAITGERLPYANENPIPSSGDVLQKVVKTTTGKPLYEPKTTAGEYANAIAQFATGGKVSGASLAQSIPAAVASEAAGQATHGTDWEVPARILAAVSAGGVAGGIRDRLTQKPAPVTPADIKRVANAKYAEVEKTGHEIPKEVTNNYIDDVKSTLLSSDELINSMKSSQPLRDAFDDIALFKDQPMTLSRAQALDEQISNMVDSHTTLGQVNKVGKKLLEAQHKLRQVVDENFDTPALREARQAWAAQAKLRDVERIMLRAETMDNPATGIKTGFRQLLTNPNKSKWFTKEELKIIEQGATTSAGADVLRSLGSRLIPIIAAGTGGGLAGTAIATAGSMAARSGATRLQVNRAMKLSDKISEPYKAAPPQSSNAALIDKLSKKQVFAKRLDDKISPPEPQKLLPAPKTDLVVDRNGAVRQQSPEESVSARSARERADSLGLTGDVRKVVQSAEQRLKTDDAWNSITEQQRQKISQQIEDAWQANKAPLEDLIKGARKRAQDLAEAKAEPITPFGESLLNATKEKPNLKSNPSGDTKGRPHIVIHPKK